LYLVVVATSRISLAFKHETNPLIATKEGQRAPRENLHNLDTKHFEYGFSRIGNPSI